MNQHKANCLSSALNQRRIELQRRLKSTF
uniref:Protein CASP, putative n=1 Tax=Arundo donax TaxID=35708 RepID=A0A0A9DYH1_ARUDO